MRTLRIYTDLDSAFDTRRGIITHLAKDANPNFTWDTFKSIYDDRLYDIYNRPSLGVTPEAYEARYAIRTVDDWADDQECYFFPTNLFDEMLQIVRGIEFGSTRTIEVSKFELSVNCYPFKLSDVLADQLIASIQSVFKLPVEVRLTDVPYDLQTAPYLNDYDYVFRYGHLLRPEFGAWAKTILNVVSPGTKYIVPELLANPFGDGEDVAPLKDTSVGDHIRRNSALLGGVVILIPTDKKLYSSKEGL